MTTWMSNNIFEDKRFLSDIFIRLSMIIICVFLILLIVDYHNLKQEVANMPHKYCQEKFLMLPMDYDIKYDVAIFKLNQKYGKPEIKYRCNEEEYCVEMITWRYCEIK